MSVQQFWAGIAVVVLGYIVGFYFQHRDFEHLNQRLNDLRSEMSARFADLRSEMDARFADLRSEMNARFADLKDLLRSEIKGIQERLERIEHPLARK